MPLLDDNDQANRRWSARSAPTRSCPNRQAFRLVPDSDQRERHRLLIRYLRVQNKVELHGVVYQGYSPAFAYDADRGTAADRAVRADLGRKVA